MIRTTFFAAEIGKEFPVVEEISAEDLRDAEDEMPVRYLLEYIYAQPFPMFGVNFKVARATDLKGIVF